MRSKWHRRLIGLILGERNAINLYGEYGSPKYFEDEAKKKGMTWVACEFETGFDPDLNGMIYPLTYPENEKAHEQAENLCAYGKGYETNGSQHSCCAKGGNGLPPVVYLQPGEKITHVLKKAYT